MYGEIITIGDELISGRVVDLNAWYAAGRLTATGLRVIRVTTVGDDQESISKALQKALGESQFVIITGGLGSTSDTSPMRVQPLPSTALCAWMRRCTSRSGLMCRPGV